jgi:hypothetical protein
MTDAQTPDEFVSIITYQGVDYPVSQEMTPREVITIEAHARQSLDEMGSFTRGMYLGWVSLRRIAEFKDLDFDAWVDSDHFEFRREAVPFAEAEPETNGSDDTHSQPETDGEQSTLTFTQDSGLG